MFISPCTRQPSTWKKKRRVPRTKIDECFSVWHTSWQRLRPTWTPRSINQRCPFNPCTWLPSMLLKQIGNYRMISHGVIWYRTIWYDMIRYHRVRVRHIIAYDVISHDMIWYDMVWYDMIRYYMICYDMLCYDMTWYLILNMILFDIIRYYVIFLLYHAIPCHTKESRVKTISYVGYCGRRKIGSRFCLPRTRNHNTAGVLN